MFKLRWLIIIDFNAMISVLGRTCRNTLFALACTCTFNLFAVEWKGTSQIRGTSCDFKFQTIPVKIEVGRFFDLEIELSDSPPCKDVRIQSYDLLMPAHKHGMIVKIVPVLQGSSANKFVLKNLKAHMLGQWQLKLEFLIRSQARTSTIDLPNL